MNSELAWAIGLFEGEGCISVQNHKTRGYVYKRATLSLASTDEDVLLRFLAIVGRGHVNGPYQRCEKHKPHWVWGAASHADVAFLLKEWLPMLGERRAAKAGDALLHMK